jgi:hypothetical protein
MEREEYVCKQDISSEKGKQSLSSLTLTLSIF